MKKSLYAVTIVILLLGAGAAVYFHPWSAASPLAEGDELFRTGKFAEAAALYRRAASAHPANVQARVKLGKCLIAMHQSAEAAAELKEAVQQPTANAEVWHTLGEAYAGDKHFGEAIDAYLHALQQEPNRVHTHLMLGQAYSDSGKNKQARAEWEKVIALDPLNEGQLARKLLKFHH